MKNFKKKRKFNSSDGNISKNHNVSKKHKAEALVYGNQLPTNWHEVKINLDATVVEKYLKYQNSTSQISTRHCKKIVVQKIPWVNQHVFSENNDVMVKLEMPENIRVGDNLLPEDSLIFNDESVKQEKCISVINSLDNNAFPNRESESIEPLHEDFHHQESGNLTVEAALKNEIVRFEGCYEEIITGPEFQDTIKNEEVFIGQEFKHEETIPSYENAESVDQENNKEIIKKSIRFIRKRKKCLDCDDCNHGSVKESRVYSQNKIVSSKLPVKKPKICSNEFVTPLTSSLRAKEEITKNDSFYKSTTPITAIPRSQKPSKRGYQCDHCDYEGERRSLINHLRNKHSDLLFPNDPVRCYNCDLEFDSWEEMQKHRSDCLLYFICKFCFVNVSSKFEMVRHMKKIHPEKICAKKGAKIVDEVLRDSMKGDVKTLGQTLFEQNYVEIKKYYMVMKFELIKLYCSKCNVTQDKVRGKNKTRCDSCKSRLLYQCQRCKESLVAHRNVWRHLINKKNACSISANFNLICDEETNQANNTFDKYGRMMNRKFSDNIKLAKYYCPKCRGIVDNNLPLNSHTKICPKCNAKLRVRCKVCDSTYSRWASIGAHFRHTDCGKVKNITEPWIQTNEMDDHSYSLRQPPSAVTQRSTVES